MTINEYFKTYYKIISTGNLDELNDYFHTNSPFLGGIKQQYEAIRKQLDFNITLESIELVSKLDDLLVIRDRILFEGQKGDEVKRNFSGNLHVMIKENDSWKLQSTTCLSVEQA
ncbi:hypothetical protein [Colwellia sp. TT2012]|uniref:hypothetical protein n=1 Tax=Colwellia sp. TT2012 TaxID=1720342 RepID=UPI00070AC8E9|nr:hypothetical protein [Colwellia sp. TT2012]